MSTNLMDFEVDCGGGMGGGGGGSLVNISVSRDRGLAGVFGDMMFSLVFSAVSFLRSCAACAA